jgi:hypothetical protein
MDERGYDAIWSLAKSMERIADVLRMRLELDYPPKREVKDATVTHRQTEEERLREAQGYSEETDAEWIGRREAAFEKD